MIVSTHAVERYVQRVKPQLGLEQARLELEALLAIGEPVERPPWVIEHHDNGNEYLEIAPDAIAVVCRERVSTVLVKPVNEVARVKRNKAKADQRRAKRTRARSSSLTSRHDRRPRNESWEAA